MSKAWNHTVRPLTPEEIQKQIQSGEIWHGLELKTDANADVNKYIAIERKCRLSAKCKNESQFMLRYYYVTGKQGRVSWTEKPICAHHASKYQKS